MLIIYKIMIIQFINYDGIDKIHKHMIIFESKIYQQSLNENSIFWKGKLWNIKETLYKFCYTKKLILLYASKVCLQKLVTIIFCSKL